MSRNHPRTHPRRPREAQEGHFEVSGEFFLSLLQFRSAQGRPRGGPRGTQASPGRPRKAKRSPRSGRCHPKEAKIEPKTLPRATRRPTAIEKHFRSNFGLDFHRFGYRKSLANRTRILEKTLSKVPSTDLADLRFDRARSSGIDFRQKAGSIDKRGNLTKKSTETTSELALSTTPFRNRFWY